MPHAAEALSPSERGSLLLSLAAAEGSACHSWLHSAALNGSPQANANLADLIHLLGLLHGSQPGFVEIARELNVWDGADWWLGQVAEGLAGERRLLSRLIVAAGPAPSTPGEASTVAAVIGQRGALETIARSERFGCAIGAVVALVLDWAPIRAVLDAAADRLDLTPSRSMLPSEGETLAMLGLMEERPRLDRTLAFGAQQLVTHHHCLLDLLSARARARLD